MSAYEQGVISSLLLACIRVRCVSELNVLPCELWSDSAYEQGVMGGLMLACIWSPSSPREFWINALLFLSIMKLSNLPTSTHAWRWLHICLNVNFLHISLECLFIEENISTYFLPPFVTFDIGTWCTVCQYVTLFLWLSQCLTTLLQEWKCIYMSDEHKVQDKHEKFKSILNEHFSHMHQDHDDNLRGRKAKSKV